jgi:hypothetical protein
MTDIIAYYDDRGACETEIQADKGGLKMERRRKKRLAAQEALILLTDVAHNLLAWVPQWMFPDEPLATFGTIRLIEDVFSGWDLIPPFMSYLVLRGAPARREGVVGRCGNKQMGS